MIKGKAVWYEVKPQLGILRVTTFTGSVYTCETDREDKLIHEDQIDQALARIWKNNQPTVKKIHLE